jgi:diacylglycerol kinase family enzyme
MQRIAVILNPHSRKNQRSTPERRRRLERIVGPWGEVHETRRLEELMPTLRGLFQAGDLDYLVADGGDGSLHWVLNESRGVLGETGRSWGALPTLVPTNGGTIDFVARKAGIKGNAEHILTSLTDDLSLGRPPPQLELDTLELEGAMRQADGSERKFNRLGFALAAGGIGQRFFDKYYAEPELGGGAIVRVVTKAVGSHLVGRLRLPLPDRMLRYGREIFSPTKARVTIDGRELPYREHGAIHAGSIDVALGGVFRVFPYARDPNVLHFQAGGIVPSEMIRALPDLCRGGTIKSRHLTEVGGREMKIEALGDELLAPIIDGEIYRDVVRLTVRRGPTIRVPRLGR